MTEKQFGMTEEKVVDMDGGSVTIHYDPDFRVGFKFSKAYQNSDTLTIDGLFGLTGTPVAFNSRLSGEIYGSARDIHTLGRFSTTRVLAYFSTLAIRRGSFVGIPEDEFRDYLHPRNNPSCDFGEQTLDSALFYNRELDQPFLRRVNVEGTDVIFPANIVKL